jgi:hypothetical protein
MEKLRLLQETIQTYRRERTISHETGHRPPPSPDLYPEGAGTEIELFVPIDRTIYNESVIHEEHPNLKVD